MVLIKTRSVLHPSKIRCEKHIQTHFPFCLSLWCLTLERQTYKYIEIRSLTPRYLMTIIKHKRLQSPSINQSSVVNIRLIGWGENADAWEHTSVNYRHERIHKGQTFEIPSTTSPNYGNWSAPRENSAKHFNKGKTALCVEESWWLYEFIDNRHVLIYVPSENIATSWQRQSWYHNFLMRLIILYPWTKL